MRSRRWTWGGRLGTLGTLGTVSALVGSLAAPAWGQTAPDPEAKKHLVAADAAAKKKEWPQAIQEYGAATAAFPAAALFGLAGAHYELGHFVEAFEAYDAAAASGVPLAARDKAVAEKRKAELAAKIASVVLRVNDPNAAGAQITVGDKDAGQAPLKNPEVHVLPGAIRVRATKPGFLPFEQTVDVKAADRAPVDVVLKAEATTGRLSVREANARPVRVFVDGSDVGPAPYEADAAPGKHEIYVQSGDLLSAKKTIEVERGKTAEAALDAASTRGRIEARTADGKGNISVDGKLCGEGACGLDVAPGEHTLTTTREGYQRDDQKVVVTTRQTSAITISLKLLGGGGGSQTEDELGFLKGTYGGFSIVGGYGINGRGSDFTRNCAATFGPASCDTSNPLGGGLAVFLGYTWNPVGVELFGMGSVDYAGATVSYPGTPQFPGYRTSSPSAMVGQPGATVVVGKETFDMTRVGGLGAARVRLTANGRSVRVSAALGVGLAYRQMFVSRNTKGLDGSPVGAERVAREPSDPTKPVFTDPPVNSTYKLENVGSDTPGASYLTPAIVGEVGVHFRLGKPTAVHLGVLFTGETATSTSGDDHFVVDQLKLASYRVATGAQLFVGPFLGMTFGP